jgi:hypothetical protein
MLSKSKILLFIFFIIVPFRLLYAQTLYEVSKDWYTLIAEDKKKNKVCYVASMPKKKVGNFQKRNEPYLLVNYFKDREPEVSFTPGYNLLPGSVIKLQIDKKQFFLTKIKKEFAWADKTVDDKKIIEAFKKGARVEIKAQAKNGKYSIDNFSLMGFGSSYKKMLELCSKEQLKLYKSKKEE